MSGLISRPRNSRGESLVEVLVSVLVGSLALLLLASLIAVSARIIKRAKDTDAPYYAALNAAEAHGEVQPNGTVTNTGGTAGTVKVMEGATVVATFNETEIEFFGGEGIWSYRKK